MCGLTVLNVYSHVLEAQRLSLPICQIVYVAPYVRIIGSRNPCGPITHGRGDLLRSCVIKNNPTLMVK